MKGSALGATLHYKNSTYLLVANTGAFDFPYGECADIDITSHGSTEKEFEPGIVDGGTMSVPIVWDDAETSHGWLMTNHGTVKQFKYTPKDGTAVEFLAILEVSEIENPRGTGAKKRTLSLSITDGTIA